MNKSPSGKPVLRNAANALGYFSIALGMAELFAPQTMARLTGMRGRTLLVRAYGMREIVSGLGLLAGSNPRPWLWSRVAGDALDIVTLAAHAGSANPLAQNARRAMMAVAPVALADLAYARMADSRQKAKAGEQYDYSDRVGLARPPEAMRGAASDFNAPRDMRTPEPLRAYATP